MTSAYVIMFTKLWPKVILRNFGGLLKRIQEQQQRQQQKISKTKVLNKDSYLNYAPLIQVSVKWTLCTVKEETDRFNTHETFIESLKTVCCTTEANFTLAVALMSPMGFRFLPSLRKFTLSHRGITYSVVANQSEKHAICRLNIKWKFSFMELICKFSSIPFMC